MWAIRHTLFTTESVKCRKTIMEPVESQNTFPIIPTTDLVPDLASSREPLPCHEQGQSLLFSKLPAEVRRMIFEFTFAQGNESDVYYGYQQNMFSCYPVTRRAIKLRTGLLSTCQKAYREAWPLVIENPVPPTQQPLNGYEASIWAKLFWFQHGGLAQGFSGKFEPRIINLNIRHWDWYGWDTDAPLRIRRAWIDSHGFKLPSSCTQLNIRFQTQDRKRGELEQIVQEILHGGETEPPWAFERQDAAKMLPVCDENSPMYYFMSFSPLSASTSPTTSTSAAEQRSHYFAAYVTWRVGDDQSVASSSSSSSPSSYYSSSPPFRR